MQEEIWLTQTKPMDELQYRIKVNQNQMMTMREMKYLSDTLKIAKRSKKMNQFKTMLDLYSLSEYTATWDKHIKSQHPFCFVQQRFLFLQEQTKIKE